MIDKQAIETMSQMVALISKYAKGAYPRVETTASRENRRRAWTITCQLARLAEHAAESDMHFLLADDPRRTDADRANCYQVAREEDREFMDELHEFRKSAEQFARTPVIGKERTDHDIVRELECLLCDEQVLQQIYADSFVAVGAKISKKERELKRANRSVISEQLAGLAPRIEAASKLARARGMVVSMNRHRTVIKRVPNAIKEGLSGATQAIKSPPRHQSH